MGLIVDITDRFCKKWQDTIDLIARIYDVPSCLIMRVNSNDIEVFLSSKSETTPYAPGDKEQLGIGLYCETVMENRDLLIVPNALEDENWKDNPDVSFGMIAYMGVPLELPDGSLFGTLCVLDRKTRNFSDDYQKLLLKMKSLLEQDLQLILSEQEEITAKNEAETALLQTREEIELILDNLPSLVASLDINLHYRTANPAYCKMYGFDPDAIKDKHISEVIGEDAWQMKRDHISSVMEGNLETFEIELPSESSEYRYNKMTYIPNIDSMGDVVGFYILGTDIHELKLAEREIRKRESELKIILDSLPALVSCCDKNLRYVWVNEPYLKTYGFKTKEEIHGLHVKNIIPEDSWDEVHAKLKRVLKGERVNYQLDMKLNDGKIHNLNVSYVPDFDEDGTVSRFFVFIVDVTEQKVAENLIRQNEKMKAIGLLAGGIAHDFNNMLGAISSAAEIISLKEKNRADLQSLRCLDIIQETTSRGADLTSKLVTFGGKGNIKSEPINVHDTINRMVDILSRTVDKSISITSRILAEKHTVIGNNAALENILLNIGINASHAMPQGGEFTITTENCTFTTYDCAHNPFNIAPGEYVKITLSDTGTGISKEDLPRVFDPFFTTKDTNKGVGLGLATVYGTVQEFNGTIDVQSTLNQGTQFCLCFPCSNIDIKTSTKKTEIVPGLSRRVLFVDDESHVRTTIELILLELGYQVFLAQSGFQAIEMYKDKSKDIDLIIMDMNMPKMSGHEAIKKLRELDLNIPIVISTGFSKYGSPEIIKDLGIAATIYKPYSMGELSSVLSNVFEQT